MWCLVFTTGDNKSINFYVTFLILLVKESEDPISFARRVQRLIAKKGGLIDLEWDGNLKRAQV